MQTITVVSQHGACARRTARVCVRHSPPVLPPVFILSPTGRSLSGTSCLLEGESTPTESPSASGTHESRCWIHPDYKPASERLMFSHQHMKEIWATMATQTVPALRNKYVMCTANLQIWKCIFPSVIWCSTVNWTVYAFPNGAVCCLLVETILSACVKILSDPKSLLIILF